MTNQSTKLESLEKELEKKSKELINLKKSMPKKALICLAIWFLFPFIPTRSGRQLIDDYTYGDAVLISAVIFSLIFCLNFYRIRELKKEIFELEVEIDYEKI